MLALLFGQNTFSRDWEILKFAESDSEALEKCLKERSFEVKRYKMPDADSVRARLLEFVSEVEGQQRNTNGSIFSFVHFATHGDNVPAALICENGDKLSREDLVENLNKLSSSGPVFLFIDACCAAGLAGTSMRSSTVEPWNGVSNKKHPIVVFSVVGDNQATADINSFTSTKFLPLIAETYKSVNIFEMIKTFQSPPPQGFAQTFNAYGIQDMSAFNLPPKAHILDLHGNRINDERAKSLADQLKESSVLTTVDLTDNDIGDDGAECLARAIMKSRSLEKLHLRCNKIGEKGAGAIFSALGRATSLTYLDLSSQKHKAGEDWWGPLCKSKFENLTESLKRNSSLTTLILSENNVNISLANALALALQGNSSLTTLQLDNNIIGKEGAKILARALKQNSSLTSLDLSSNKIGDEGAREFASALRMNSSLITLYLSENDICQEGGRELGSALQDNSRLAFLDMCDNRIDDKGAQEFAAALKTNSSLISLYLNNNSIGDEGTMEIGKALLKNSSLTCLDLSGNLIGDEAATTIATALKTNRTLNTLSLYGNECLTSKGLEAIANALTDNISLISLTLVSLYICEAEVFAVTFAKSVMHEHSSLEDLYFDTLRIGDKGVQALATGLAKTSSLHTLQLIDCNIGCAGAKVLASALKTNSSLREFTLDAKVDDSAAKSFANALMRNRTLKSLDLRRSACEFGDDGAKAIATAMGSNSSLTSLALGTCQIGDDAVRALNDAKKDGLKLTFSHKSASKKPKLDY